MFVVRDQQTDQVVNLTNENNFDCVIGFYLFIILSWQKCESGSKGLLEGQERISGVRPALMSGEVSPRC